MRKREPKQRKKLNSRRNNKKQRRKSSNHHHVNQELKNLQEVLKVVQVVGQKVEPLKVGLKLNLQVQEDKVVERQVEQKEVASVVREGEVTLRDQGEGAISGVSLISQYLQIRI